MTDKYAVCAQFIPSMPDWAATGYRIAATIDKADAALTPRCRSSKPCGYSRPEATDACLRLHASQISIPGKRSMFEWGPYNVEIDICWT